MKQSVPEFSGRSSVAKTLMIYRSIVAARGETAATDLAREAGLPPSTARRLIADLVSAGLIARIDRGRYDVTPDFAAEMAGRSFHGQLARVARPVLHRFAARWRTTLHLGIFEDDMVTYLVRATPGRRIVRTMFTAEGGQLEAYCSAIGKILLAALPEAHLARYLEGGAFVPLTPSTIVDPSLLSDHLGTVAARGYATDDEEVAPGMRCFAAPVSTGRGIVAAVSVSCGRDHDFWDEPERGIAAAQEVAEQVMRAAFLS